MNLVVSDASPIRYLVEINAVDILPKLFSRVVIPEHVVAIELQRTKTPVDVRAWVLNLPNWVEVRCPLNEESLSLDKGEEQAIALALELRTPILLDEKLARVVAERRGLVVIGTVGLIERAAAMNLINLASALEKLQRTNIRVHPTLIEAALNRAADLRRRRSSEQEI